MNKKETAALFALISALFPRDEKFANADKPMILAWQEMLEDIPFDVGKAAVKATVASSPFPPSIKDIRDYSTRMNGKRRKTAEEAWGEACEAMRNYGTRTVLKEGSTEKPPEYSDTVIEARVYRYVTPQGTNRQYEAELHLDPEVWAILKHMGYKDVVESENPDVVRGQFMRAWDSHNKEEYEKRVIGGILPEFLKDMNLLGGGQNGELLE